MSEPNDWLAEVSASGRERLAEGLNDEERAEFPYHWHFFARTAQLPPPGNWRVWLILAGRGFGKTRAGAEWVRAIAEGDCEARIALVSSSLMEARSIMVEGESGIIACCPPERRPVFEASLKRLRFPNGAEAHIFSSAEPELLRGPQHSHAWCDEIGKWPLANGRATRCWDNLLMGMRLGTDPRIAVTTTPRNVPLITRLTGQVEEGATVITRGPTHDNRSNLPDRFLQAIEEEFGGSQLGRQEIEGELLDEIDGALWNRAMIERIRETRARPFDVRIVVAVDPPASSKGDACGIVVAALGEDGIARVLADCSVENASPEKWAERVALAASDWNADRVIAEANQGGEMVASVMRAVDRQLPIKLVHASRGKSARAEPIAALYETEKVRHCGLFPKLEDQLCGLMTGGEYVGSDRSPDRADALVWALTELMLSARGNPRVRPI